MKENKQIYLTRIILMGVLVIGLVFSGLRLQSVQTNAEMSIGNYGYPYGKSMNTTNITLVIDATGASSYQWQLASSSNGSYTNIEGATSSTYTFSPQQGAWYRCVVDGVASKAVQTVTPSGSGRTYTYPCGGNNQWYITNGTMAYMTNGSKFDITGLYVKNGTTYMLQTVYGGSGWLMYSNTLAEPTIGNTQSASLDAFKIAFNEKDAYAVIFEADLSQGQQSFAFGCDTQLGNSTTSNGYHDKAALVAMLKNDNLQQISMIGASSVENARDDDPAFVISPVTKDHLMYWLGYYSSRKTYAYATSGGGTTTSFADARNVVEGQDSGMTMSWTNVPSGGSVKFQFSVGDVASTGAVNAKIDYITETLTDLEPNKDYEIRIIDEDGETYIVTATAQGTIPFKGIDKNGKPYDIIGKKVTISLDNGTPVEIDIASRPVAEDPSTPNSAPKPEDVVESDITTTTTSITIKDNKSPHQQYSVDGGVTWVAPDSNGNAVFTGLTPNTEYRVQARIAPTDSAPASVPTEGVSVITYDYIEVQAEDIICKYDGNNHSFSVDVTNPMNYSVTYAMDGSQEYASELPVKLEVGEYVIYYRIEADNCYPVYGHKLLKITPREVAITWSNTTFTYDGESHKPTATVIGLMGNDVCDANVTVVGNSIKVGTPKAKVESLSNGNYELPENVTKEYTINPKEIGIDWSNTTFEYDGSAHKPTATAKGLVNGDTCILTVSGEQINVSDSHEAKVTSLDNSNYKLPQNVTTKYAITPIDMVVSSQDTVKNYDGSPYDISVLVTMPVANDSYTIKYGTVEGTYDLSECPTRTEYGTTTVYYQVTSDNYNTYTSSQKIIISQSPILGVSAELVETTYDGNDYSISVIKPDNATVVYKTSEDGEYESSNPSFQDAGTYTVYYKVMIDDNYESVEGHQSVIINQKEVGLDWTNTDLIYNGEAQQPIATATGLVDGDSCTVTVSGARKDAGSDYIATAVELDNNNYKLPSEATKAFEIVPKDITLTVKDARKHIGKEDPKLEYTVEGVIEGDILMGITLKRGAGEDADIYEIEAFTDTESDTNYNIQIVGKGTFIIEDHDWSEFVDDNNCNTESNGTRTAMCKICGKLKVEEIPNTKIKVETKAEEKESADLGNGKIITVSNVDSTAPKTIVDNLTIATAMSVLTEEELESVRNGADVKVYVDIININDSVSVEDKAKVEALVEGISAGAVKNTYMYLDISLFKRVSTEEKAVRITELDSKISVTIEIPAELRNTDDAIIRSYYIVRVHEGKAELITPVYDSSANTLTFVTDRFSTYAIVAKDIQKEKSIKTGDETPINKIVLLMMCSLEAFLLMLSYKIKKSV